MKTFLIKGILPFQIILLFILPGCTDVLDLLGLGDIKPYEAPENQRMQIDGIILADHVGFIIGDRNRSGPEPSFMYGVGILDQGKILKISSRHTHLTYQNTPKEIQIEEGQFEYIFENGDILFGTYNGYGSYLGGDPQVSLKLNISGGAGNYKDATGNIEAIVNPDPESRSSGLKLELTGMILVPEGIIN